VSTGRVRQSVVALGRLETTRSAAGGTQRHHARDRRRDRAPQFVTWYSVPRHPFRAAGSACLLAGRGTLPRRGASDGGRSGWNIGGCSSVRCPRRGSALHRRPRPGGVVRALQRWGDEAQGGVDGRQAFGEERLRRGADRLRTVLPAPGIAERVAQHVVPMDWATGFHDERRRAEWCRLRSPVQSHGGGTAHLRSVLVAGPGCTPEWTTRAGPRRSSQHSGTGHAEEVLVTSALPRPATPQPVRGPVRAVSRRDYASIALGRGDEALAVDLALGFVGPSGRLGRGRVLLGLVAPALVHVVGALGVALEWKRGTQQETRGDVRTAEYRVVAHSASRARGRGTRGPLRRAGRCLDGEWHALSRPHRRRRPGGRLARLAGLVSSGRVCQPVVHLVAFLHQHGPDVVALSVLRSPIHLPGGPGARPRVAGRPADRNAP
jgi:hypothetical protein